MALYGTLGTMPLPELLEWIHGNRKTGVLELERNQICKRVDFREGRVIACSSDDPGARFGQYLLSHGKITEGQLSEALSRQGSSGKNLGTVLREMGALTEDEEKRQLAHKAEENLYSLFDWLDAVFRFREDAVRDPYGIDIDVAVEHIVFEGMQRRQELDTIREVFESSGLVLRKTVKPVPSKVRNSARALRILELVDGERTIAELLLHAHATEHTVVKFLHTLYRMGIVEICGVRPVARELVSILDDQPVADPVEAGGAPQDLFFAELDVESIDSGSEVADGGAIAADETPELALDETPLVDLPPRDVATATPEAEPPRRPAIEAAIEMMNRGHFSGALDLLGGCYQQQPNDESLRQLLLRAEGAYLQDVRNRELRGYRVPVVNAPADLSAMRLEPIELFLLNTIDGKTDIQSLLWITPQREIEIMRTLEKLAVKGLIELTDPVEVQSEPQLSPGAPQFETADWQDD